LAMRFLNDVVSLLKGEKDCIETKVHRESTIPQQHSPSDECAKPGLDLVVIFDNTEKNVRKRDSSINSNRYLLLDVLGSLKSGARVRVSVVSFGDTPKITLDFTDISERDRIFAEIESIRAVRTQPSYAEAISLALAKIQNKDRADAQTALVILGNGNSKDTDSVRDTASSRIRQTPSVTCFAVDSSPSTNVSTLEQFTGSPDRVYPYERTAEFAKVIKRLVNSVENAKCKPGGLRGRVHAAAGVEVREAVYSTPEPSKSKAAVQRDALVESLNVDKINEGKLVLRKKVVTSTAVTTTPTATTAASTPSTTTPSSITTRRSISSRRPSTPEPSSATDVLTKIQRRTTTSQQSTTTQPSTTSSKRFLRTRQPTSLVPPTEVTTRTTRARTTTTTASTTPRALTSPSFPQYFPRKTTDEPEEPSTTFKPGCLLDLILVLDSSGSVEETFLREKELAAGIVSRLRVGPNNARVSIIKFAGTQQVKTVWSFANLQSRGKILRVLNGIPFTSGTTAIHSALLKALAEYTTDHGARPGHARPVAIIFTDGYAQKSTSEEAAMLRAVIPDTYAIAINHSYPISRTELEVIVGSPERVFTDSNIGKFHDILETIARDCIVD
uniref:VWFA domain-containing protein n=1 Tax=Haemonchus placei TaxID=6290 RepID=A0A158QNN2_HAEPC